MIAQYCMKVVVTGQLNWRPSMDARHPLRVVTPSLDGDVLTHLALTHASFTPGQLARLLPKASVEGVRRVLNRLVDQGIVLATRVGDTAVVYALNHEHVGADAVIALANQARTLWTRIGEHLAGCDVPPVYAAVFGSWARGAATVESDVDILLVRPASASDDVWERQVLDLQEQVTRWTGNDARPFVLDEAELDHRSGDAVLTSIVDEGLTVYGDPTWLRSRVRRGMRARDHGAA